jgi:D-alanyl-D-alanine carboxypeptidase
VTCDGPFGARLRATVAGMLRNANAPGATIALVVDGRTALATGVGCRDLVRREPIGIGARFPIYSVTKVFLAVAVLRLVEQGRLALDDPMQAILPEAPIRVPVTVRQLLKHTGGLPDYGATPEYARDLRADPGRGRETSSSSGRCGRVSGFRPGRAGLIPTPHTS